MLKLIKKLFPKQKDSDISGISGLHDFEKGSSITSSLKYPAFCELASKDDKVFASFRKNPIYTAILEHVDYKTGKEYLKVALESNVFTKQDFEGFARNDLYGGGVLQSYPEIGKISPSTLRYIKVLSDLILHFGNLDNLKICEIGVGYGGQARIIMSKFDIQSYTFVDLQSTLDLSKKYLSYYKDLNQEKLHFTNLDALKKDDYDLVISNYAFSELSRSIQDLYLEKIINNAAHGYITYNDISDPSLGSYKIENYKDIIHKNIQILEEKPLTHPLNKIVVW